MGWGWYTAFGKVWQDALGKRKEDCKPTPLPFIVAVGCLLMAWMLAGLMGHLADVTLRGGVISAFFVWVGFVLTTTATNQAFRGAKPIVTSRYSSSWARSLEPSEPENRSSRCGA